MASMIAGQADKSGGAPRVSQKAFILRNLVVNQTDLPNSCFNPAE